MSLEVITDHAPAKTSCRRHVACIGVSWLFTGPNITVEYLEQGRIGYKIQGPGQIRIKDKRFCPVDLLPTHNCKAIGNGGGRTEFKASTSALLFKSLNRPTSIGNCSSAMVVITYQLSGVNRLSST